MENFIEKKNLTDNLKTIPILLNFKTKQNKLLPLFDISCDYKSVIKISMVTWQGHTLSGGKNGALEESGDIVQEATAQKPEPEASTHKEKKILKRGNRRI